MRFSITALMAVICLVLTLGGRSDADVPASINVQGQLTDSLGVPVPEGTVFFTFRIFDAATGGFEIWPGGSGEVQPLQVIRSGLWSAHVGAIIPLTEAVFADTSRWLEISVDADGQGPEPEETLSRVKLNTVPFSYRAAFSQVADTALAVKNNGGWTDNGTVVRLTTATDSVGIGTFYPQATCHVEGTLRTTGKANFGPDNYNPGASAFVAGSADTAGGHYSTVAGGQLNVAAATLSAIGGGNTNRVRNEYGTIGGGSGNEVSGFTGTISGGRENTAGGAYSTVAGGQGNFAGGDYSLAAGHRAYIHDAHDGTFLFADQNDFPFESMAENEFAARVIGGVRLVTGIDAGGNATSGVQVPAGGGSWSSMSDRGMKENFHAVDSREILNKVARLPLSTWNYKSQDVQIRHIGPMAQDFHEAFGLGEDNRHITTIDADGIALAAIQALHEKTKEIDQLKSEIAELRLLVNRLLAERQ